MQPREPLERYLHHVYEIYSTGAGVDEESYYGALEDLLNAVGGSLRPRVRCVGQLSNTGAGEPDFGLFTQDQFQRGGEQPLPGQKPSRGVLEVKGPYEGLDEAVASEQVHRYLLHYGLVLATNYREFRLLKLNAGKVVVIEGYTLAVSGPAFWLLAAHPRKAAGEQGEAFFEFLQRALLYNAPLSSPKDVAWFLASYAREARARVEQADVPALAAVRSSLEEALGLTFQDEKGDHFFRSTLVQTLFYGIFAAWVLWRQQTRNGVRFDWRHAGWELHVPMIQALYAQLSMPQRLRPLGLETVLDLATDFLNRIDADAFFAQFSQDRAVQYFYEPFLQAFDPELRDQLGVWYTPPEIVEYMTARVDTVLRKELGIEDGLADPSVYVLDPCCGTGAYLVEVLRRINLTLEAKGMGALSELELKKAAMTRIFGFEILPAPFVVAHLQLGLLLHTLGNELTATDERVGVYLTNALTGWQPPTDAEKKQLDMLQIFSPEMRQEVDAAGEVKRSEKILVIIGNPPYNGFAGTAMAEERDLCDAYRTTKTAPRPQGQGLNDLYVRFYRMAERQIVERARRGVVCYISNYSWLDGLSFTGMREKYLEVFDRIWIDCMNGDKYKTGKLTPEGDPDPSVFSTEWNREGIQVGTAIGLLVKTGEKKVKTQTVKFRHLWGKRKREELLKSLEFTPFEDHYNVITPARELGLPFINGKVSEDYLTWPLLPDLFPVSFPGIQTSRDDLLVDIDRDRLIKRMKQYFDPSVSDYQMSHIAPSAMADTARFPARETREILIKRGIFENHFIKYLYRPFDIRWLYWEPITKLLDEKRLEYFAHVFSRNIWIALAQKNRKAFDPPCLATIHAARHLIERGANLFPLRLRDNTSQGSLFGEPTNGIHDNISDAGREYLSKLNSTTDDLFYYCVGILYALPYQVENAGALRHDWPRIPLPAERDTLFVSAALGRQIAALLDPEAPVPGVTAGQIRVEMRVIGVPARIDGGSLHAEELAVTAGWGHAGQGGVTMPARGKAIEREYTAKERVAITAGASALGLSPEAAFACLGETTFDIYLNERACWRNVPARAWEYRLGGYQVIKKWLSYRESSLLTRALTPEEAFYVADMSRRITALLLLAPALDDIYRQVTSETYAWSAKTNPFEGC